MKKWFILNTKLLIYTGVGDRINAATLRQKDLQNVPASEADDWSRQKKKRIVDALRTDLSKILPKVPQTITCQHVDPISVRGAIEEEAEEEKEEEDNRIIWYDIDDDDDDANDDHEGDGDGLDVPDENGVTER